MGAPWATHSAGAVSYQQQGFHGIHLSTEGGTRKYRRARRKNRDEFLQALRRRMKGVCSLSSSCEMWRGPGLAATNFTSRTSVLPQALFTCAQNSLFISSNCFCQALPSAATSRHPLWQRTGRVCRASVLPTTLGQTPESHATAASGRFKWRSIPPRKFPARSIEGGF